MGIILANVHKLLHIVSTHVLLLFKIPVLYGCRKGSGLKISTPLAGDQGRCIHTQSDYSITWGMFSGGTVATCSKSALERTYPLAHTPSLRGFRGFRLRKPPGAGGREAPPAGVLTAALPQPGAGHARVLHDQGAGDTLGSRMALCGRGRTRRRTLGDREEALRGVGKRHDRGQYCWCLWAVGFQVTFTRRIRQKCSLGQPRVKPKRTRKYKNGCRKVRLLRFSAEHTAAGRPLSGRGRSPGPPAATGQRPWRPGSC